MTDLEIIRTALKAGRGLALDAGERALDQEFANAIEMVDRLLATRASAVAGLDVDRLARALVMCGYPPVHELHASQGASGHYEHDNAAYAAAIAREYAALSEAKP